MDEVKSFFDFTTPGSKVTKLRGPTTAGIRITRDDSIYDLNKREEHRHSVVVSGTDYAREIREAENDIYVRNMTDQGHSNYDSRSSGLESMEHLSSYLTSQPCINELTDEAMNEVYSKYSFKLKEDTASLPINDFKQEIMDGIKAFPVAIIEGPTGCGKTTQVPQWILDHCYQERTPCKIVVTQPRRIAAISIAKRVAQERGWDIGGLVGYQVGLENRTSSDTRISYVTTGVLLQKLVATKTLNEYTHVILDEVHERGQEMDFLMLVVKKLLYTVSKQVHVVLMSATLNKVALTKYFLMPCNIALTKKEPMYTVKTFYLDQLKKFSEVNTMKEEPGIPEEMYHLVIKLLKAFEQIDQQEDKYADRDTADLPSVLIFLPGINEIEELFLKLNDTKLKDRLMGACHAEYRWSVLPLHSTITVDEQARVFQRTPPGQRKIILSTNIAESSITVPDIKYVVDFCLMKILVADEHTNFTSLQLSWASKTNCEQRAGRAGRVRDGRVYRLVTEKFYENLPSESPPEMRRCPLERLVLLAKMLDMGPPSNVLALAMDPPDMSNIHRTILVLKEMGALKKTLNDEWDATDGDLTYLGRIMAKLPLDVRASKLIVLGHIYGCLEEAIIMAAAMSVKSIFSSPFRERLNAYSSKLTWADGSTSDSIALYNVYKVWDHLRRQQDFKQQGVTVHQWARRFYVQVRALRELDDLVRELKSRLSREGIEVDQNPSPWTKSEQSLALKIILAGAVYPQYFVQVKQDEDRERDAVRTVGGLDPRDTVYLKNFPEQQPPEVYGNLIRKAVATQIGHEPRVTFDTNSRKVFLTFEDESKLRRRDNNANDPTIPGQVVLPIYKAIKARTLKMDIRVPLLPEEEANALAATLKLEKQELSRLVPRLPDIDDSHFPLRICQFNTVSSFWVQYDDESTTSELHTIQKILNKKKLLYHAGNVSVGDMYAAPYVDANGSTIHRVRILKMMSREMVEVLYIDYGSIGRVSIQRNLFTLPDGPCRESPPLAMRCRLAGVAPSPLLNHHGQWTDNAVRAFTEMTANGHLIAKVYSVTHGTVSIELLAEGGRVSVNKELVKRRYAIACEESYDSKLNHDLRETATEFNLSQKRAFNREQVELAFSHLHDTESRLNLAHCVSDAYLKGPYSPLESVVHNLMYASREKQVTIEWNSVNSVLLDTEPQEIYERLLVSAEVGQNEQTSKLTLRHTTLMPNVPGLPAIIALLFCPVAELRRDPDGTRYVSALCGLGAAAGGAPYFPDHDLLVTIDAELAIDDIGTINHVRYLMDYMLYTAAGQDVPTENEFHKQVPKTIRKDILELFRKHRKHREPTCVANAWEWHSVPADELLEITRPEMVEGAVIYPLHTPQELRPHSREHLLALKLDNEQLKIAVTRTSVSSNSQMTCKLCGTQPMPAHAMRIHLYSNAHKEKEDDLKSVDA